MWAAEACVDPTARRLKPAPTNRRIMRATPSSDLQVVSEDACRSERSTGCAAPVRFNDRPTQRVPEPSIRPSPFRKRHAGTALRVQRFGELPDGRENELTQTQSLRALRFDTQHRPARTRRFRTMPHVAPTLTELDRVGRHRTNRAYLIRFSSPILTKAARLVAELN